ncbi:MAG TPA: acetyl-CoA C-acetyltransferase [Candidatus Limnocylindrales bacterium]|nr:acetyl-CoA C-acetyltransferase [Candidatus Limnocylindrales bacterium]
MSKQANEAWIIDAVRTPRGIGKQGKGALSHLHPQRLSATVLSALAERNGLDTAEVDDVIWGCSTQVGRQGACVGRMSVLDAGWDTRASAVTLDRFCGSGITAVNLAAASLMSGMEDVVVAGGVEMMSFTATLPPGLLDAGNLHLRDLHPQPHQGVCADVIATLEGITRENVDALALESQRRAQRAIEGGHFDRSVVPVYNDDGSLALAHEEFPRPQTTLEGLAKLPAVFANFMNQPVDAGGETFDHLVRRSFPDIRIDHVHHAGNSSGVVDGSAGLLLSSPDYAKGKGWKPRARVVAMANAAGSPELMLNEPVPAARKVLAKAGMTLDDIDLFEINEAFAVVAFKFMRDLEIDPAKCNVNGGAIALGHPIAATGSILIGTILDELERRDLSTGLVTMCAAGGMAPAIIIERL